MPISIPTNIAGISVPTDAVNGPLAALYGNKYQIQGLKYPRDLGSNPARNHVIKFSVLKRQPVDTKVMEKPIGQFTGAIEQAQQNIRVAAGAAPSLETLKNTASATASAVQRVGAAAVNVGTTFVAGSTVKESIADIFLYVPDTVNVTYNTAYDDISITESLGKAYFMAQAGSSLIDLFKSSMGGESIQNLGNKVISDPVFRYFGLNAVGNALGMRNLGDLGLQGINRAINPQLQVLFRGVGFRTFQFDFLLTPYNEKEAQDIKSIIYKFKYHSSPRIVKSTRTETFVDHATGETYQRDVDSGLGSPFFEIPETFKIEFFYKGAPNPNVNKIAECVLTNVNVDYAPAGSGWATHNEGAPVQTRLTLQFQEIEIIDKTKIKEGY